MGAYKCGSCGSAVGENDHRCSQCGTYRRFKRQRPEHTLRIVLDSGVVPQLNNAICVYFLRKNDS